MCCGESRLKRLTRDKFRKPPPEPEPAAEPVAQVEKNPAPNEKICPQCGSEMRKIASCCRVTWRCINRPACRYQESYSKRRG